MKKILCLALCLGFLGAPSARADKTLINAVVANTDSVVIPVGPATTLTISVKSAAGSDCVVTIKQKLPSDTTWFTVATITDPSETGELWKGTGGGQIQISVSSWVSGTITVNGEAWAGMNQLF